MFRPPTLFYANRKAVLLRRTLVAVGHPIDVATARRVVARAWGWLSWEDVSAALERPAAPSPLDEDLVGPGSGAMVDHNRLVVAERRGRATRALVLGIGLPQQICINLSGFLGLTGRHRDGEWMSPRAFRQLYAACVAPKPRWVVELLDDLRDRPRPRTYAPLLHRPR